MMRTRNIWLGVAALILIALIIAALVMNFQREPETTVSVSGSVPATSTSAAATASSSSASSAPAALASTASPYPAPSLGEQDGIVQIGTQTLYVNLAENPAQQELGLGNRTGLGADQGMLFIFPNDDLHMFWMKDMRFSIDMIWFSDDGTVIYIAPNVAPDTYPAAFGPNENSRYVLEVPANYALPHNIQVGDKATLP